MAPRPSPPAAERVGDEVTRLLSTHVLTAVVAILGFESRDSVPMSELANQVHPLLGGVQSTDRRAESFSSSEEGGGGSDDDLPQLGSDDDLPQLRLGADYSHCQGIGPQSFGTVFDIDYYDAANRLLPRAHCIQLFQIESSVLRCPVHRDASLSRGGANEDAAPAAGQAPSSGRS